MRSSAPSPVRASTKMSVLGSCDLGTAAAAAAFTSRSYTLADSATHGASVSTPDNTQRAPHRLHIDSANGHRTMRGQAHMLARKHAPRPSLDERRGCTHSSRSAVCGNSPPDRCAVDHRRAHFIAVARRGRPRRLSRNCRMWWSKRSTWRLLSTCSASRRERTSLERRDAGLGCM